MKNKKNLSSIFNDKTWLTVANILTVFRMILTPLIVYQIFYKNWIYVFCLIIIVGITDLLDGYLARRFNHGTNLGKMLDPIADKFLIVSLFASLAFLSSPSFYIPYWFVIFVLVREVVILFGSFFLMGFNTNFKVSPTIWGKLTTLFQILFILWIFLCYFCGWVPAKTYYVLLVLLTTFSVASFAQYLKIGFAFLSKK